MFSGTLLYAKLKVLNMLNGKLNERRDQFLFRKKGVEMKIRMFSKFIWRRYALAITMLYEGFFGGAIPIDALF